MRYKKELPPVLDENGLSPLADKPEGQPGAVWISPWGGSDWFSPHSGMGTWYSKILRKKSTRTETIPPLCLPTCRKASRGSCAKLHKEMETPGNMLGVQCIWWLSYDGLIWTVVSKSCRRCSKLTLLLSRFLMASLT